MSQNWHSHLSHDPLPTLLGGNYPALEFFTLRDLLDEDVGSVDQLWKLPQAMRLVAKQQADGAWRYPRKTYDPENGIQYNLLETYRNLRVLVEMYGFTHTHLAQPGLLSTFLPSKHRKATFTGYSETNTCRITMAQSWSC
jgi:hypothetical protein